MRVSARGTQDRAVRCNRLDGLQVGTYNMGLQSSDARTQLADSMQTARNIPAGRQTLRRSKHTDGLIGQTIMQTNDVIPAKQVSCVRKVVQLGLPHTHLSSCRVHRHSTRASASPMRDVVYSRTALSSSIQLCLSSSFQLCGAPKRTIGRQQLWEISGTQLESCVCNLTDHSILQQQ